MANAHAVQLMRQSDAVPALDVLRQIGAPVARVVCAAGLPESFEEGGDGFIPFRQMLQFIGHAARDQDVADLCWRGVLSGDLDRFGGWGRAVAEAPTLRRAIMAFSTSFKRDAPLMDIGLDVGDEYAWFWRSRPKSVIGWLGDEEGQQYALGAMIRVARTALGDDWLPPAIHLESSEAPWTAAAPSLGGCNLELGRPVVAIAIPTPLLDRASTNRPSDSAAAKPLPPAAESLSGSLQQAFTSLLPAVDPTIEHAAAIADISPRSLRRRLREEGTCWRSVRDEARLCVSLELLAELDRPIANVADQLCYSDAAHFVRAFRRWTGESPHEYRRRHLAT